MRVSLSKVLRALPDSQGSSSLPPRLCPPVGAPAPMHPATPLSVVQDQHCLQRKQSAWRTLMTPIDTGQISTLSVGERGNTTPPVHLELPQAGLGLSRNGK